ncbi:Clp protease N-terminal domain-containing protein [uncultured Aquimarina sp.]|uniref:Clp protease N-terminal domain-containing protein n=1 Tax=uncultured Aquimarina sp. TaxID=575652 RepID=UPI00260A26B2|nr:Clp protease N-terminal domain-containing protein [uncultured Aquimarina sp.]
MKFSSGLEKIIAESRLTAIDLSSGYISSYHFLIASLKSDNLPKKIFESNSWKFEKLIESLKSEEKQKVEKYYLTKEFESTLKHAKYYARTYLDNEIKTEHIILSMIADKKSFAGKYLTEIGMDYSKFKTECEKSRKMKSKSIYEFFGKNRFFVSIGIPKFINGI